MSSPETTPSPVVRLKRGVSVSADVLEQMERAAQRQGSDFTRADSPPSESTPAEPAHVAPTPPASTQPESTPVAPTPVKPVRVKSTRTESKQPDPAPVEPTPAVSRGGGLRTNRLQAYVDDATYAAVQARALELDRPDSWVAAQLITQALATLKAK